MPESVYKIIELVGTSKDFMGKGGSGGGRTGRKISSRSPSR